jgi:hypothetical protein
MSDRKFIETARAQFKLDCEQEREIREEARLDIEFRAGEQWDPDMKRAREADGRPALTFDKTHVFIQSVANEARQNKPEAKVNPIGGGATTDTAVVINGILRHIHYRSKADVAWDTSLDYSCGSSFGFARAITECADPKSFDQEIRILAVLDPFAIYGVLIPACLGEVCKHAFVIKTIPREEYRETYGKGTEPSDFESSEWKAAGDWIDGKNVRLAEYWWLESEKKTLRMVQGKDGSTTPVYVQDKEYRANAKFVLGTDGEIQEREVDCDRVYSCLIDGTRVLPGTKTEWAGDSIPIVAVLGQQLVVEGEAKLFSLIRFIRDVQRLINIYESAIAEKIGLANRVPYIGFKGQFTDPKWVDANVRNYAFLEADLVTINGATAPLPQRQQLEEQITALSRALAQEIDNLKAGMGIFDASLGNQGNETSGVGIQSRQQQSNVTNFHFSDNLNRAQWDMAAKLLKVIPKIYDRPGRQVRIVGEDQVQSVVVVNQPYTDQESGKQKHYALNVGEYDVVVTVGPSYTTARAEGADTLQQFFKAAPQLVPLLGDLWVGSLDYPWSREAARRLKLAAPQNIVNEPEKGQNAIPPQLQAQLTDLQNQLGQAHQFAASLHEQLMTKQPEIDARVKIAQMQEETKRSIAIATIDAGRGEAILASEDSAAQKLATLQAQQQTQGRDHAHQLNMAARTQQAAALSQQSKQLAAAGQQASSQGADAAAQASGQAADARSQASSQQADAQSQASSQQAAADSQQSAQDAAAEQQPAAA